MGLECFLKKVGLIIKEKERINQEVDYPNKLRKGKLQILTKILFIIFKLSL